MSRAQYIAALFLACSLALLAFKPDPAVAVAVVSLTALFVGVTFIERKQSTEFHQLADRVTDLKNKVDMLLLNKGFGR